MEERKESTCQVSRWQILKHKLNNLGPEDFKNAIQRMENAIVIDVRTAEEFQQGHIHPAINLDYLSYDFWEKVEELDPAKTYYVYCRSGRRSIRACTLMTNGGFARVFNLDGGLDSWEAHFNKAITASDA
jgi:rhodanese-related sulfurtransferase